MDAFLQLQEYVRPKLSRKEHTGEGGGPIQIHTIRLTEVKAGGPAMSTLNIRHTSVFTRNLDACQAPGTRIVVNQGGTRSSKTVSLVQLAIYLCLLEPGILFSIVRETLPALTATVLRDFEEQLTTLGLYQVLDSHNKKDHLYTFPNGSQVEYFSIDDAQKIRGRKRDYLLAKEANELHLDDWRQFIFRTSRVLFIDYNPSEEFH